MQICANAVHCRRRSKKTRRSLKVSAVNMDETRTKDNRFMTALCNGDYSVFPILESRVFANSIFSASAFPVAFIEPSLKMRSCRSKAGRNMYSASGNELDTTTYLVLLPCLL